MIYLGLELLSLSLYAMVALQRDSKVAAESAVKYFVMGGLASGFLLYGISLVYGTMGTIIISDIAAALKANETTLVTQFGLVFLVIGLAFKFGAVPFHMWLPDIYHGAPSSTTAYIASAPKIAAFGMAIRILDETFALYAKDWSQMILILGLLSVAFGNVVAVAQHNFKRMLAYSAIAHIGYFLLAIVVHNDAGYAAAMYYIIVYAVMTLAGFGIVIFLSTTGEDYDNISDLKGMGEHHPWYALLFSFVMVSMAGIPPFIGFWPKLEIFRVLLDAGLVFEAVIAIAFSVVGLFYYLRVIKEMYFAQTDNRPNIATSRSMKIALSLNCLLLLVLGLTPDSVYQ
ncbi:MAG: NADH:ubiquinone oxidoreductase subunit N, partial [Phototrophicales bacterium]